MSPKACIVAIRLKSAPLAGSPGVAPRKRSKRKPSRRSAVSSAAAYPVSYEADVGSFVVTVLTLFAKARPTGRSVGSSGRGRRGGLPVPGPDGVR
jgi:hypothetical protein